MDIQAIVKQVIEELAGIEGKQSGMGEQPSSVHSNLEKAGEQVRHIIFAKEKIVGVDHPQDVNTIKQARAITPARIGIGHTGTRMKTREYLDFRIDHAAAQDAVTRGVSEQFLSTMNLPILQSKSTSIEDYLMNLNSGRKLDDASRTWAEANLSKGKQVQIIISDGLSSTGIEANIPDLLPALIQGLKVKKISYGEPIFIKRSRVWIQDEIASIANCDVVISLIGERPGLATAKSISAYLVYRPTNQTVEADRTVISNIHDGGIPPIEAGAYLSDLIQDVLTYKASGVKLAQLR
ncbi:ethanolamine ammonia-lyase subunit EutC [Bacillus rubiinfantis]|uniref:ethanolamine ammonia-lyase subunit EutC n=1 Tax=Bacillus rubiinfantis TaxID=1499680 RepID=UPI0005AA73E7|nr:ethanolamine ammonia-lyase subunit EutC [Bacillus rubiinfantis]